MKLNFALLLFAQLALIIFLSIEKIKVRWEIGLLYGNQDRINTEYQNLKEEEHKLKTEAYFLNSPARVEQIARKNLTMQKVKPTVVKIK